MRKILSIAGFDPSGGAGLTLDSLVAREHGFFCYGALTVTVAQSSCGVKSVFPLEPACLKEQLQAVAEEGSLEGVKLGLIGTVRLGEVVAEFLKSSQFNLVVCDPVIRASDGTLLVEEKLTAFYREAIFPLVSVVTFNLEEARLIFKAENDIQSVLDGLKKWGGSFVLKGGHVEGTKAVDYVYSDCEVSSISLPRLERDVRGTGCAFSTSLLCQLTSTASLKEAAEKAKEYVFRKIKESRKLGLGSNQMVFGGD